MKILVAYFSASGITKEVAETIAKVASEFVGENGKAGESSEAGKFGKVELFEIAPKVPYSKADLDWTNEQSRTTIECKDKASRPELAQSIDISPFSVIIIGFPVWWYNAPHIIFSFLESADFSGKIIVPFCTSGGSGIDPAPREMQKLAPNAIVKAGEKFNFGANKSSIRRWLSSLNLEQKE